MKMLSVIFVFILQTEFSFGSNPYTIDFFPQYNDWTINIGGPDIRNVKHDTILFSELKFYITNISFIQNGKTVFSEQNSFHLISADALMRINFNLPENLHFDQVKFSLGVDSITNNSGVLGGDLDPTKGMYWTWQSGYINFKLEGNFSSRNKKFEYHIGGYAFPYNACREVSISAKDNNSISVYIDFNKFFANFSSGEISNVMSPGKDAMKLSTILADCFYAKP